jgi:hypothetical protein
LNKYFFTFSNNNLKIKKNKKIKKEEEEKRKEKKSNPKQYILQFGFKIELFVYEITMPNTLLIPLTLEN